VIIACSEFVKHFYRGRSKTPDIEVVYPFVIEEEQVEELKSVQKKKIIGMIGKFIPWKGQDTFIHMAKKIHERHPQYQFVIIGAPYQRNAESKAYFEECQRLIDEQGLKEVLKIIPEVSNVLGTIAEWEILVHCSKEPEPLGRVVLEGMVAGCAVVASKLGGPQEIIDDQQTGLLTTPHEDELVVAIEQLIEHQDLRAEMARKGQEYVQKSFSRKPLLEKIEKIFRALVAGDES
jgi:glycosyltransferase involved in cell wall biosynthesis